jgi:hypothetical protein
MPETNVVPFLPRSALFVIGMTARYPALRAIAAFSSKEEKVPPMRRHLIVEKLIRSMPVIPAPLDAATIDALGALGPARIDALAERQRGSGVEALRSAWEPTVSALEDGAEREFAHRCGTLFIELFRRRVRESGLRPIASHGNA